MEESPNGEFALNLLLIACLIVGNAFFVAAEFALVKVRQTRLTQLANEGNAVRARYAQNVTRQLDLCLSACQLGITAATLALGWIGGQTVARFLQPLLAYLHLPADLNGPLSVVLAFVAIVCVHVVFAELTPKSVAMQKAEATSLWVAGPLLIFTKFFRPLVWMVHRSSTFVLRKMGIDAAMEPTPAHTEEELRQLVSLSHQSGHIDQTELALVDKIFMFSERLAREIMIPRIDMTCLYDDYSFEKCLEVIRESRHSRFPVAQDDKDNLIGFVHASDFYLAALTNGQANLKNLLRPLLTVPETMEISHVLHLMQKERCQLAIVIDEYGGTAGLLTMEDILEEIVGDIQDEFDVDVRPEIEWTSTTSLSVSGKTLLSQLNRYIDIDVSSAEVDTVAGWLYNQLSGVVEENSSVTYEGYRFTVSEWEQHRITRVTISVVRHGEQPADVSLPAVTEQSPLLPARS